MQHSVLIQNLHFGCEFTPLEQVRDWVSAFALVRESLGVTVVPAPTLPADRRGLWVLPLKEELHRYFGLQRSDASSKNPAIRPFLDLARDDVVANSVNQGSEAA